LRAAHCGALLGLVLAMGAATQANVSLEPLASMPGHILPALARATPFTPATAERDALMTLTVTLKREDSEGLDRYLHDVYDATSASFHRLLSPVALADRFGPSRVASTARSAWRAQTRKGSRRLPIPGVKLETTWSVQAQSSAARR